MTLDKAAQQRVHLEPGERVERPERFVAEQQPGFADERAGEPRLLLLAVRVVL